MVISIIAAVSKNRVIGNENRLPWHLTEDLKHFKQITMGKPIIMGRKTYGSIGKPLPGRHNIIVTRDNTFYAEGCTVVHSLKDAIDAGNPAEEVMIIGGANIYEQALPLAHRLYLTLIHKEFEGDTFFPEWNEKEWNEIQRYDITTDETGSFNYSFVTLERTS